jgi:hypothetical protein
VKVRKFTITDATLERSPGQDGDVFVGNLVDQRHGSPITIGYGRYGPNQTLEETMAVDDVMVVLEGRLSVSGNSDSVTRLRGQVLQSSTTRDSGVKPCSRGCRPARHRRSRSEATVPSPPRPSSRGDVPRSPHPPPPVLRAGSGLARHLLHTA